MQKIVVSTLTNYLEFNPQASPTVIILPGWGQHSQHWQSLASQLPNHYRYLLLDLPGFGGSQHLSSQPGVPQYSQFVADFINKLNLDKPILLGHSFGGQIALHLSLTQPDLISHQLLISPAAVRLKTPRQKIKLFLLHRLKFLKKIIPSSLLKPLLKKVSSSDYYQASPQHRQILKQIVNFDLSDKLKKITPPTTIVWGEKDKEIPYQGQLIVNRLPHARLRVIYGAGHNPHLTHPQELIDCINHHLSIHQ